MGARRIFSIIAGCALLLQCGNPASDAANFAASEVRILIARLGNGNCYLQPSNDDRIWIRVESHTDPPDSFKSAWVLKDSVLLLQEQILGGAAGFADWYVQVPAGVVLRIGSRSGMVSAQNIMGRMQLISLEGRVLVRQSGGDLDLETKFGSIRGDSLSGWVAAQSEGGDIKLTHTSLEDGGNCFTYTGNIHLQLSVLPAADVDIKSISGSALLELPAVPQNATVQCFAQQDSGYIRSAIDLTRDSSFVFDNRIFRLKSASFGSAQPYIVVSTFSGVAEIKLHKGAHE